MHDGDTVTRLLREWREGDSAAADALFSLMYEHLHAVAGRQMQRQRDDHTLQATALVHEAWIKLAGGHHENWTDRAHFFAVAARAMRSVLVDHARHRSREKRTPPGERLSIDVLVEEFEGRAVDLVALHEAMERLEARDPHLVRLVDLRFFSGLSMQETSTILGVALRTLERDWKTARTLLRGALE